MRILNKSCGQHRNGSGPGYGYPGNIRRKRRQRVRFIYKESVEVPGMGPGESYMDYLGEVRTARRLLVKKTLNTGRGLYLRGLAGDVMPRQYGACDICRSFGDAVCVAALATTICIRKRRCQSRAL